MSQTNLIEDGDDGSEKDKQFFSAMFPEDYHRIRDAEVDRMRNQDKKETERERTMRWYKEQQKTK